MHQKILNNSKTRHLYSRDFFFKNSAIQLILVSLGNLHFLIFLKMSLESLKVVLFNIVFDLIEILIKLLKCNVFGAKESRSSLNLRIILSHPLVGLFEYLFMFWLHRHPKFKTVRQTV